MLQKLKEKIENNMMFNIDYLQNINIDEVLDLRDDPIFDEKWIKVYEELTNISLSDDDRIQIDEIRKAVYKKVYEITEHGDLAAYISDDFELICKAYICNYEDAWLASMASVYANTKIPYGVLGNNVCNFIQAFNQLA